MKRNRCSFSIPTWLLQDSFSSTSIGLCVYDQCPTHPSTVDHAMCREEALAILKLTGSLTWYVGHPIANSKYQSRCASCIFSPTHSMFTRPYNTCPSVGMRKRHPVFRAHYLKIFPMAIGIVLQQLGERQATNGLDSNLRNKWMTVEVGHRQGNKSESWFAVCEERIGMDSK